MPQARRLGRYSNLTRHSRGGGVIAAPELVIFVGNYRRVMSSVTLASSVADCMRGAFAFQSARHVGTHVLPDREIFCTVLFF